MYCRMSVSFFAFVLLFVEILFFRKLLNFLFLILLCFSFSLFEVDHPPSIRLKHPFSTVAKSERLLDRFRILILLIVVW